LIIAIAISLAKVRSDFVVPHEAAVLYEPTHDALDQPTALDDESF
jgi:hypothetical protein